MTDERESRDHCGNCRFFLTGRDRCCANPPVALQHPEVEDERKGGFVLGEREYIRPEVFESSPACRFHTLR